MSGIIAWVMSHLSIILGVLWGLSEALASIPKIAANSVFQLIHNLIKKKKAELPVSAPVDPAGK